MSKLSTCLVAILASATVTACGDDGITIVDAAIDAPPDAETFFDAPPPMYDWTCIGNMQPTMAAATITVSGKVEEVGFGGTGPTFTAVSGATVRACDAVAGNCNTGNVDGTDDTAADGTFSISLTTGAVPLNDFLDMRKTGAGAVRTTFVYPASPFTANFSGIPILTFDDQLISFLGVIPGGCTQDDTTKGMLALAVTDCGITAITDTSNLDISVKQGGNEVQGTTTLDLGALAPQAAGTFLVCNVPVNATTTVGATYTIGGETRTFRAHDVKVVAGTTTATLVRPGW